MGRRASSQNVVAVLLTTQDLYQNEHRVLGLEGQIRKQSHFSFPSYIPWVQIDHISILKHILKLTR